MSPNERREMIRKKNTELSLTRQCKLLKISRSSIYYTPVGLDQATLDMLHEMNRIFTKYPFFGSCQIATYLPQSGSLPDGIVCGALRTSWGYRGHPLPLMHERVQRTKHEQEAPEYRIYPYPLRKLPITRPNQGSQLQAPAGSKL
jgi:putative transposase